MVRKPGKRQKSKERCQDLGWKVHYRAKYFVLRSYTMHELRNQHVSIALDPPNGVNNYCARSRPKNITKAYNRELFRVS